MVIEGKLFLKSMPIAIIRPSLNISATFAKNEKENCMNILWVRIILLLFIVCFAHSPILNYTLLNIKD